MAKFIYVYHGGTAPSDPKEMEAVMGQWNDWYASMGDKLVDGGGPAGGSTTVTPAGVEANGGANPVSGYTVVEAADRDAAVEMARGCPLVVDGSGSVEVCEIRRM